MAKFQLAYGNSNNLENLPIEDGKLIFTPDTKELYIDYAAEEGGTAERLQVSADTPAIFKTINTTGTETIIADAISKEQVVTADVRKTYNIYDFDHIILEDLPNRAYTTDFLPISDYSFINISDEYQYWCHFYDENKVLIGGHYWHYEDLALTSLMSIEPFGCKYFRLVIKKHDDGDFTPNDLPADVVKLTINPNSQTLNGADYKELAQFAQGTIVSGEINTAVTTRIHLVDNVHIKSFQSVTIPEGYKTCIQIYNRYNEWLASSYWIQGPATITPQDITNGWPSYSPAYMNLILGTTNDDIIDITTLPQDLVSFSGIINCPSAFAQGTITQSIISSIAQRLEQYENITEAVGLGQGTLSVTGTLDPSDNSPAFAFDTELFLRTLEDDQAYTLSIRMLDKGSEHYIPMDFAAATSLGRINSVNGAITFTKNDNLQTIYYIPKYKTQFNETKIYFQLEKGNIAHNWEECSSFDINTAKIYITDLTGTTDYNVVNNEFTGVITGPEVTITHDAGIRIENLRYQANIEDHIKAVDMNNAPAIHALAKVNGNIININDAIKEAQTCTINCRKTYNLYNFDETKLSYITNRVYTSDLLPINSYYAITVPAGQSIAYHLYDSDNEYLDSYYWVTGATAVTMDSIKNYYSNAAKFNVTVRKTNDSDFTPEECQLELILNPVETETITLSFAQGTVDTGVVNPNVTTRLHLVQPLPLINYQEIAIPEGYKAWFHFYDPNMIYKGGTGQWLVGPTTSSLEDVLTSFPNLAYFDMVIGTTADDTITPETIAGDIFNLTKYKTEIPNVLQGTLTHSVVEQLIRYMTPSSSYGLTAINHHDGTFTINGTLNYNYTISASLETLAPIYEVGNTYTLSIKTKSLGDTEYTPFDFTAESPYGSTLYSQNGAITFDYNADGNPYDLPKYIYYNAKAGEVFNNTTFYIQIEKGKVAHDWEEYSPQTINNSLITIKDYNQVENYVLIDNKELSVRLTGPTITITTPQGIRAKEFEYFVDTKAYVDNHMPDLSGYVKTESLNEYVSDNYPTKNDINNIISILDDGSGNVAIAFNNTFNLFYDHDAPMLHPQGIIPEGATYMIAETGEVLTAGQSFPEETKIYDRYNTITNNYWYKSWQHPEYGWKEEYGSGWVMQGGSRQNGIPDLILETINGKPVTDFPYAYSPWGGGSDITQIPILPRHTKTLEFTFANCNQLTYIPQQTLNEVTDMYSTFSSCQNLINAENLTIGENINGMSYIFDNCRSLTKAPIINGTPSYYYSAFRFDTLLTEIKGTCQNKEALLATINK